MKVNVAQLDEMLSLVADDGAKVREKSLCWFPTHFGSRWSGELMVCGRSPNGFDPVWSSEDVATRAGRSEIVRRVRKRFEPIDCQMRWITDAWKIRGSYNTVRSAFWRVTLKISSQLEIVPSTDTEWSAPLAWTNLYRLAPSAGGNPSAALQRLQRRLCIDHLRQDLEVARPRRLLLLTGIDWATPFLQALSANTEKREGLVEAFGTLFLADERPISVVVAKHPQGKREKSLVDKVAEVFARAL